ncbi:hypothetical protein PNQ20_05385 [Halobacterium salinarum]|uniref:hypothetical protein n=1 Tax=Halobacterium salinarum TaxID=2242 RepID=UPI0025541D3C|nr:hypothetical protein [Halobacterium salinarum]MDL0136289.1 hypothetical protein [Halobacterium salinarum]
MNPAFTPTTSPTGLRVHDRIENAQFELYTESRVAPTPIATGSGHGLSRQPDAEAWHTSSDAGFALPVDSAVAFDTTRITLPALVDVFVWQPDRTLVGKTTNQESATYPEQGAYALDVDIGSMKLQLAVTDPFAIHRTDDSTVISFDATATVRLGARSLHTAPEATITITDDVRDGMRAVSLFGSALKTTTPERSFPTLRGHPPLVERGDAFDAPATLDAPDTGIAIEIPLDWGDLYRVSTLAYYLGATVQPGAQRALVLDGVRYPFPSASGFGDAVQTLLEHVFLLDCVVRTEGLYSVSMHERTAIEPTLGIDLSAAYDAPPAERLAAYLGVPFAVTEPHGPQWPVTADIAPDPGRIAALPFVVDDLANVRVHDAQPDTTSDAGHGAEAVSSFLRSRSQPDRDQPRVAADADDVVVPPDTESIEHVWLADGVPVGANKATAADYQASLACDALASDPIRVVVVCNDPSMDAEDCVSAVYGMRDFFEFDISVRHELSTSELATVLESTVDFLHYIGHTDATGFQCVDGRLDARDLDTTGVRAFLLNSCQSHAQGRALVDRGSQGGIVTVSDIDNDAAVRVGHAIARLLNNGFSLLAGLSVARNVTAFGNQYVTVGDGSAQVVQSRSGVSLLAELAATDAGYEVSLVGYPTTNTPLGSLVTPYIPGNDTSYLNAGHIGTFNVAAEDLRSFFDHGVFPVLYDGTLTWSDKLTIEETG